MATIYAFLKIFEKKEYADDFINGKLYMNTIKYFKEYIDISGELRGDRYEGISAIYQPAKIGSFKVEDIEISGSELSAPILVHDGELLNKNAFCIYSLNSSGYEAISAETLLDFKRTIELHESCFGLGNFCVAILNAQEFIDRCTAAIKSNNFAGTLGAVSYYDEREFHGEFPSEKLGYQKQSFFSHQREYRVLLNLRRAEAEPYTLNVGSLADIARLTTPQEFNRQLKLKLPDGSHA